MLKITIQFFIAIVLSTVLMTNIQAQRNCGSMNYLEQQIRENPERAANLEQIEKHTNAWIKNHGNEKAAAIITIPVVFHVVYNNSTENISDAQILSQLQVLNDDFRRLNSDANGTWSQAADTEIEFCLATVDPSGNSTSGITRTSTSVSSFGTNDEVKSASTGGKNAWPAADYLNFWICDISGGILGYAQFPGGPAATDGVVCDHQYVGTVGTATAPFNLGRTATHEVGHWLNLRHIWGDGNCGADDFVSDTPTSDAPNYGCASGHVSCSSTDMVENYMDYSDDACMNLFTSGQKSRMLALFSSGGARASLASSGGCGSSSSCTDGIQNGSETGVDCGGSCPPCSSGCSTNDVTLTLIFDNYPEETSWQITNAGGSVVESGGTYGSQPDGSTLVIDLCLADGCYDFTINDAYGDGICCSYGSGSYNLSNASGTLASGGSFGSSETTNFCLGTTAPTCTDGVQNGSETGIDCGGPDCSPCGGGSTTLFGHFFESGWDGWADGGGDCYRYSGSRSWEGNYSIRLRDNSGTASAMTSSSYNVSAYNTLEIEFYFYAYSMENGEDFWVRYYDGSSWNTVATYARGTSFNNNTFYSATVTISSANYNFPSNARFRFQCDASANADHIYIDAVTVTASNSGSRSSGSSIVELGAMDKEFDTSSVLRDGSVENFEIYPNPTSSRLTVEMDQTIQSIEVYNISGELVHSMNVLNTQKAIDVSNLQSGLYILAVKTESGKHYKKVIKQ